ncbi:MAG: type III secretion inner membrane ring lipoprotein SctJ, partial [Chlamydiae bacterium]|nr:type III secretion inner membrane ring lipoprotein SctJ [Chlamydiota bacterium]
MGFKRIFIKCLFSILLLALCSCEKHTIIVNDVPEREANEIIVFLVSKGIEAAKTPSPTTAGPGAEVGAEILWSIVVEEEKMRDAMAILNQNGLPRKKGISLLDIFAKKGLVSTEKEENIRYQAGLAAQIAGTIRKIDGVIDADVQISIPEEEVAIPGTTPTKRITAAIYVKHQGILDDPNSHLVTKIKRLVSGSISGLDINDVTVISDRSRFTDITLPDVAEATHPRTTEYV